MIEPRCPPALRNLILALAALGAWLAFWVPGRLAARLAADEASAVQSLQGILGAERAFRSRGPRYSLDLTSLAEAGPPPGASRLGPDLALGLKDGYRFGTVELDEAGRPLDPARRFAYYASPVSYGDSGRRTFLAGEDGRVYARDLGNSTPPPAWPADDPLAAGWTPLSP